MRSPLLRLVWSALRVVPAVLVAGSSAPAAIKIASPFTSHMVLQRDLPVPVWGIADVNEEVIAEFAGQRKSARATPDGRWYLQFDALGTSAESRTLTVRGSATPTPVELTDVLVGEVWLASGQSNMDFTVAKTDKYYFAGVTNEEAEVAAANFPKIRMFTGEWSKQYHPATHVAGEWKVCSPETVREFSAIGYFFARKLHQELGIPIGIVTLTYGASTAQAWIRRSSIEADPSLRRVLEEFDAKVNAYTPPTEAELAAWKTEADAAKAAGKRPPRRPKPDPVQDQHNPTVMFNGMIAPVVPYAIRGVLWYQGESITAPKELFPRWNETLIRDWRQLWGRDLPFYFCQLAAHDNASNSPQVREWQTDALKLPATAMAVTIDIGDAKNVHPKNKQDVGDRLARIALARNYGRKIEYAGPTFASAFVQGAKLRVKFTHVDGGLIARNGPLATFEIAGADDKYLPATATIDGDAILVESADVPAPAKARYAWSPNPEGCNLYNAAGLPAPPFRTDGPVYTSR